MSQNSTTIQNTGTLSGLALVNAINDALDTVATNNSGAGDPGAIGAYKLWADVTNGVLKQRNAADTGWVLRASLAETLLVSRSSNTILAQSDFQRVITVTGTWTQTFGACADLWDGWYVDFKNEGAGTITFDPNGAETIDGAVTIVLLPGESCRFECDGTQLKTVGRAPVAGLIHAATNKVTPVGADEVGIWDSVTGLLNRVSWTNIKATIYADLGTLIAAGTAKATPVDADVLAIGDSAASNATKKLTFANLWAWVISKLASVAGSVLVSSATGLVGYTAGAGGIVTQATSKTTAVTLNKPTGQIAMNNAALAAGASVLFQVNNSLLLSASMVNVTVNWNANYSARVVVTTVGSFYISVKNETGGSLSDAVLLNFNVWGGSPT